MKKIVPWKILSEAKSRGPGGWLRIITRLYELPNGKQSTWDLFGHPKTVATLCITSDNQILLVRQYRPGPDSILDEMPGGIVEENEDLLDAAARELREETGWEGDMELVGDTWLASTSMTRRYVAIARNCRKVTDQEEDDGEYIEPITKDVDEFIEQVRAGRLTDTDLAYLALDYAGLLLPAKPWPNKRAR